MAMELIEGPTLHQVQQRLPKGDRKIEESRVIGWALQVLDGLTYLHSQPRAIIHRDIKPHNLMLTMDGRVVLVDFGLMKQTDLRQIETTSSLVHAVGTVEYAPPEQYADSGEHTDVRTDIYSLGATLYHLLAGTLPPRSVDRLMPMSILDDIAKKPPSLCAINPTVSRRTEQIIFKAMEVDPDIRYQSAAEMREDLCPRGRIIHLPF
jgi:serine/threonine-protein kinase